MNRTILMLEDDEDDRYITQTVFDENHADVTVQFTNSSQQLMKYLQESHGKKSGVPSLILLSYHAIASNTVETLKELKANEAYRHIPVVILSGSIHAAIVKECYFHGASSFIQKPSSNVEIKISNFIKYWFETVALA